MLTRQFDVINIELLIELQVVSITKEFLETCFVEADVVDGDQGTDRLCTVLRLNRNPEVTHSLRCRREPLHRHFVKFHLPFSVLVLETDTAPKEKKR